MPQAMRIIQLGGIVMGILSSLYRMIKMVRRYGSAPNVGIRAESVPIPIRVDDKRFTTKSSHGYG